MNWFKNKNTYKIFLFLYIFTNTLIGCVPNINDNNIDNLTSQKTQIALLLPIGSTDRNLSYLGKSLRDAAFLAKEDLGNNSFDIKTYDTFGKTNKGLIAYETAVKERNEIFIGPYLAKITRAISNKFPFNNFKILSLSNDPTVIGKNIFILGDTVTNRANNLIKYSLKNNKKRFALINPIKNKNEEIERKLVNKISLNNGILTFSTNYSNDIAKISKLAEIIKQKSKISNTDVIIFTGNPDKNMLHLAAELADISKSKSIDGIQIIGLSSWSNSASIISEPAFQNSWLALPDDRFRTIFENKFIKKFGYRPHPKSNLTYDAIAALGVLDKRPINRNLYQNKFSGLFNSNGFIGIDGIFRFNNDRIAEKELSVIQIINGQPNIIKKARNRFP